MVGGDEEGFTRVLDILEIYGKKIVYIGESGSGQATKMVNQVCVAGVIQSLAEALSLGKKMGLDMTKVLSCISEGAAGSWQMKNRSDTMLKDQFPLGFAVEHILKDLKIVSMEGDKKMANLEMTKKILTNYQKLVDAGLGRLDSSALIKLTNDDPS